jgi:hypothetical protein
MEPEAAISTATPSDRSNYLSLNALVACSDELRQVLPPQGLTAPRVPNPLTAEGSDRISRFISTSC